MSHSFESKPTVQGIDPDPHEPEVRSATRRNLKRDSGVSGIQRDSIGDHTGQRVIDVVSECPVWRLPDLVPQLACLCKVEFAGKQK